MGILKYGFSDLAALRTAVEKAQRDSNRSQLLNWLSSVDPSEGYNDARKKHEKNTGNWLIRKNEDFEKWKTAPNSLMWLSGKGAFYFRGSDFSSLIIDIVVS